MSPEASSASRRIIHPSQSREHGETRQPETEEIDMPQREFETGKMPDARLVMTPSRSWSSAGLVYAACAIRSCPHQWTAIARMRGEWLH